MKRNNLLVMAVVSTLLFGACNSNSEKTKTLDAAVTVQEVPATAPVGNSGITSIKNMDKSPERQQMVKKRRKELENLATIDQAKFESWVPETLGDLKRTSVAFKLKPVLGEISFMNAANGKNIELSIFDGAGMDGAFRFAHETNYTGLEKEGFEETTDLEIYRVNKRAGEFSGEFYFKFDNSSKIITIIEDRYIISVKGSKMNPDELWKYVENLNFKALK